MALLNKNSILLTNITKQNCSIINFIGSGGQGEVYKVKCQNRELALKWYYKHTGTKEQEQILSALIKEGSPNERFLWPLEIVHERSGGFGYIMELRPPQYKVMVSIMNRSIEPTFYNLLTSAIYLADSFFKLHAKGLCYRDISYNNIFINPDNGNILICDNDNVTYDNEKHKTILGTPKFMAPEIVTRKSLPNQYSDLYSLAILLFYLLFISHPLEGKKEYNIKCLDIPAMNMLYGESPVFIFDPKNDSNRPVPGVHGNAVEFWDLYPKFIKDAFIKAFTDGIKDPKNGRVRETIWRSMLLKLRNMIIYCKCGAENFYDHDYFSANNTQKKCWNCGRNVDTPPRIKIDSNIIMLNFDTKIYPCQIDKEEEYLFDNPAAIIVQNPDSPSIWGIRNVSENDFFVTSMDGKVTRLPKGKSQTLINGIEINFGKNSGKIKI